MTTRTTRTNTNTNAEFVEVLGWAYVRHDSELPHLGQLKLETSFDPAEVRWKGVSWPMQSEVFAIMARVSGETRRARKARARAVTRCARSTWEWAHWS